MRLNFYNREIACVSISSPPLLSLLYFYLKYVLWNIEFPSRFTERKKMLERKNVPSFLTSIYISILQLLREALNALARTHETTMNIKFFNNTSSRISNFTFTPRIKANGKFLCSFPRKGN